MRRMLMVVVILVLLASGCASGESPGTAATGLPHTLRVGLIPNQAPDRIRAQYQPFQQYLSQKLNIVLAQAAERNQPSSAPRLAISSLVAERLVCCFVPDKLTRRSDKRQPPWIGVHHERQLAHSDPLVERSSLA